jgi:hypothetical protein
MGALRRVEAGNPPGAIRAFIMFGDIKRITNMNSSRLLIASTILVGVVSLTFGVLAVELHAGAGVSVADETQYNASSSSQGSAQFDCGGQCP